MDQAVEDFRMIGKKLILNGAFLLGLGVSATAFPVSSDDAGAAIDTRSAEFRANCRSKFDVVDASIAKAGAGYAGYHRIKGFPYLRSDRMLASFGDRVKSFEAFDAWTYELRENDGFARNIELANMGMPDVERSALLTDLRLCAVWLSNAELAESDSLQEVYQDVQPPEHFSPADPAKLRQLDMLVQHQQAAARADLAKPADRVMANSTLWSPKKTAHSVETPSLLPDPLGRIGFTPTDWQEKAERFAPNWLIETAGPFDRIGAPAWSAEGKAVIDPGRHVVYYIPSYARVGDQTLVQLVYFVWFSERTSGPVRKDPLDGNIDGLIWRVTFDRSGNPFLFDSMHMSGFDQMWFAPAAVAAKSKSGSEDPVLIGQVVEPREGMTVVVHSGSHNPWHVVEESSETAAKEKNEYELVPYDDLMTLSTADGGKRSFFDARGIVPGSERAGTIPNVGFPNAGAIREWGTLPTSITGRHFFDDPRLIEKLFEQPMFPADSAHASPVVPLPLQVVGLARDRY